MEAVSAAAAAVRSGSLVRAPARTPYGCARGPRRVVGAGLAAPGRHRWLATVTAVPEPLEPLPSRAQEGAMAHASKADGEVHGDGTAAAETSSPSGAPGKTVRVRFVLKEQCPFGQSFHLVGDDPALSLWDPVKAIPLQWGEGHEWIVEKDLPANKLIEFKFLLRDTSGRLQWQNGPNRSLQTGETANTLVVYEDWSDVKNQKIEEEGEASIGTGDSAVSDDNETRKDNVAEDEVQMDDRKEIEQDESIGVVAEDDEKSAITTNDCGHGESMKANKADRQKPFPRQELEMHAQHYAKKENGYISFADESYAEKTGEENIVSENGAPVENGLTNAYEHDFLWGWKALQQLLMSLGFKMDTS